MTVIPTTAGKIPYKEWMTLRVNKKVQSAVPWCNLKDNRMILVCFEGKSFNITVIKVYVPTNNADEAEVKRFCEDL